MLKNQDYWIKYLELVPHPEGGFYRRILESGEKITNSTDQKRPLYTSIYFLLTSKNPSHLHRLKSDEVWYFHQGSPLQIHLINQDGDYKLIKLGNNPEKGELLQALVPKGSIFGSSVKGINNFSLVSCMVSPGFDYTDFELFTQQQLLDIYPAHHELIEKLAFKTIPK